MEMLERVKNGTADYQFIEVMACPGGCIGGGGQPVPVNAEIRKLRRKGLFDCDRANELRKSHENPEIIELYDTWLGKPLGEKSTQSPAHTLSPANTLNILIKCYKIPFGLLSPKGISLKNVNKRLAMLQFYCYYIVRVRKGPELVKNSENILTGYVL